MTLSAFSFRMLRRDLHAGELRVLFLAIIIATASVSSVGFFTDRVQQALRQQANELLAADLVISADHPISEQFIQTAKKYDLRFTQSEQFRSMVLANGKNSLAEVKAVGPGYPLRGHLHIAKQIFGPERVTEGTPLITIQRNIFSRRTASLNLNTGVNSPGKENCIARVYLI